jgi:hypothetical protein
LDQYVSVHSAFFLCAPFVWCMLLFFCFLSPLLPPPQFKRLHGSQDIKFHNQCYKGVKFCTQKCFK